MISLVEQQQPHLQQLCRKHRVRRLEVFGSAADETFRPETSDLDNVLAHGYDIVDHHLVWGIIEAKLPILIAQAETIVAHFSGD